MSVVWKMKTKRCKVCKGPFEPIRPLQSVCGWQCGTKHAIALSVAKIARSEKDARKELKQAKAGLLKVSDWIKKVDAVYNPWVRARDAKAGLPCPSCLRYDHEIPDSYFGKWDCGHYLGKGSHPELRYTEINTWRQCKKCNGGSGNYAKKSHTVAQTYRLTLIEWIGLEKVEFLEGPHPPVKWTIDDLKALEARYKQKLKGLQSS